MSVKNIRHVDTSHSGNVMVEYISRKVIRLQSPTFFQNIHLQHAYLVAHNLKNHHSSHNCDIILFSRPSLRRLYIQSFFECCLIKSTHLELFFNETWSIYRKVFFKLVVLNAFGKFLEKHQGQNFHALCRK